MSDEDHLLTVRLVAERWGVSTRTVLKRIHEGKLRAVPINKGSVKTTWRIWASEVEKYEHPLRTLMLTQDMINDTIAARERLAFPQRFVAGSDQ